VSKGLAGIRVIVFLCLLEKQAIKLGAQASPKGGQQTQMSRSANEIQCQAPILQSSPWWFLNFHSCTEHFITCFRVAWGNCGVGLSEKLQQLQNRAVRILLYAINEDDIDKLFQALGWRKLSHQRLVATCVMMFKTLHGLTPEYLQSRFVSRNYTPYSKMAAILVFFCLLENEPLLPRLRENIFLNFEFKNEVTRADLQVNKKILK